MKWVVGFVVWLVLVLAAVSYPVLVDMGSVGAGLVAKEVCSCMVLGGRDYASCRADLRGDLGLERVGSEPLASGDGVRAWAPLGLATRVARGTPERGCTLD
jgi:hypothetical protein